MRRPSGRAQGIAAGLLVLVVALACLRVAGVIGRRSSGEAPRDPIATEGTASESPRTDGRRSTTAVLGVVRSAEEPWNAGEWLREMGLAPTPAPEGGLPIMVRIESTGERAADVPVLVFQDEELSTASLADLLRDPVALALRCRDVHVTDERGEVRVRWLPVNQHVLAVHGGRRAGRVIESAPALPIVLELRPPATLRVEVSDRPGVPKGGIPVLLGFGTDPGRLIGTRREETAADGIAGFADVDLWPRHLTACRAFVALERSLSPPAGVEVDLDDLPAAPVRLVLPDHGRIAFQIVDERDRIVPVECSLGGDLRPADGKLRRGFEVEFRSGRASLEAVGLGMTWALRGSIPERRLTDPSGPGPTRDGETVSVDLRAGPIGPLITGRLLDPDGTPAAERPLRALERSVLDEEGSYSGTQLDGRTDAEGRFSIDLHTVQLAAHRRPLLLTVQAAGGRPAARAFTMLPPRLEHGVLDLGDVILEPEPATITGRVVDSRGRPIQSARVGIAPLHEKVTAVEFERRGFNSVESHEDGSFAILGWPGGTYTVSVHKWGYEPPPGLARETIRDLPASDVTLRLDPGFRGTGCILGSVLLDPTSEQIRRSVAVVFRRTGERDARGTPVPLDSRGVACWAAAPPGRYDATVTIHGVEDPREVLAQIDGIEVKADAVTADPRLQHLDLRGRLRELSVTVLAVGGEPAAGVLVRAFVADSPVASARCAWSGDEPVRFLTTHSALDVEALGQDGTIARQLGAIGDVTLRLERVEPIVLRVLLEPHKTLRDQPFRLAAVLLPSGTRTDGWEDWASATVGADGVAQVKVPRGGEWTLRLVARKRDGRSPAVDVQSSGWPIVIDAGGTETTCVVTLDEATIESVADRLR